ncbi:MAG: hypothetical protein Q8K99_06980 [Actinomycetota bacterium]|nr:hypothetical protein [Actinomycetota bacterium]
MGEAVRDIDKWADAGILALAISLWLSSAIANPERYGLLDSLVIAGALALLFAVASRRDARADLKLGTALRAYLYATATISLTMLAIGAIAFIGIAAKSLALPGETPLLLALAAGTATAFAGALIGLRGRGVGVVMVVAAMVANFAYSTSQHGITIVDVLGLAIPVAVLMRSRTRLRWGRQGFDPALSGTGDRKA